MERFKKLLRLSFWTLALASLACGGELQRDLEENADGDADGDSDGDADGDSDGDADGDGDGDGDADGDDPCIAGESFCADGFELHVCDPEGGSWTVVPCTLGCTDDPEPRCLEWSPSNLDESFFHAGDGMLGPGAPVWQDSTNVVVVDTGTGAIYAGPADAPLLEFRATGTGYDAATGIDFQIVEQPEGAPAIGVFSLGALDLPEGARLFGIGPNALAIVASGTIRIAGTFNCRAYMVVDSGERFPGPGGWPARSGPGAGADGHGSSTTTSDGGAGGAGYGGTGGASGPGDLGGAGGSTYGETELIPLIGGSGGGRGADAPGAGGNGGGACELVAMETIVVEATGLLDAAGEAGRGAAARGGGGGGGSGGAWLLESSLVIIDGFVAANGGGGGSGATSNLTPGVDGERGSTTLEPAAGGVSEPPPLSPLEFGCDGGSGGAGVTPAGGDNVCESTDDDGGGGGGGVGRIRLNGLEIAIVPNGLSPALESGSATRGDLSTW